MTVCFSKASAYVFYLLYGDTKKFTILMCTVQQVLVCSQGCTTLTTILIPEHFTSPPRKKPYSHLTDLLVCRSISTT